jgi:hypothetical protein
MIVFFNVDLRAGNPQCGRRGEFYAKVVRISRFIFKDQFPSFSGSTMITFDMHSKDRCELKEKLSQGS